MSWTVFMAVMNNILDNEMCWENNTILKYTIRIFIYPGMPKAPMANESGYSPNEGRTYGGRI